MNTLPGYLAIVPGAMAGAFVLTLAGRWFRQLLIATGKLPTGDDKNKGGVLTLPLLFATIFNPVPWLLLIGLPYWLYWMARAPPQGFWLWFVVAMVVSLPCLILWSYWMQKKARKKRIQKMAHRTFP